ncbi:hypothetical protein ACFLXN_00680 [Chloroflexota bacterium]
MSKILKQLKTFVKWLPQGDYYKWYKLEREPRIYPLRFKSKEERMAHSGKLDSYLTLDMYQ